MRLICLKSKLMRLVYLKSKLMRLVYLKSKLMRLVYLKSKLMLLVYLKSAHSWALAKHRPVCKYKGVPKDGTSDLQRTELGV